jgi:hypothetical protein
VRAARPAETVTVDFTEKRVEELRGKAELAISLEEIGHID